MFITDGCLLLGLVLGLIDYLVFLTFENNEWSKISFTLIFKYKHMKIAIIVEILAITQHFLKESHINFFFHIVVHYSELCTECSGNVIQNFTALN